MGMWQRSAIYRALAKRNYLREVEDEKEEENAGAEMAQQ
jgi:hypothetical protein